MTVKRADIAPCGVRMEQFLEDRRGLLGAREDEWCAGLIGGFPGGEPLYGTLEEPEDGEPMIVRVTDGEGRWSQLVAIQVLPGRSFVNLVDGKVYDLEPGWEIVVYSGVSRIGERVDFALSESGGVFIVQETDRTV